MREALLIQMNDFDRLLETRLRFLLDRVVTAPVPVRRPRGGLGRTDFRSLIELAPAPKTMLAVPVEVFP